MVEVLGTLSPGGYNLREGGGSRGKMSEESKQKNRESNSGENSYWFGKTGNKHHMFGKTRSEETKHKIGEVHIGKTVSKETKQKMRESKTGEKNHNYGKTGERHPNSKRVYQYDLDGNFVQSFGSGREAGRHLGKHGIKINECARSQDKNKTAYGFKWSHFQLI
jgi:group I intron endonuclease